MADSTGQAGRYAIRGGWIDTDDATGEDVRAVVGVQTPVGYVEIEVEVLGEQVIVTPHLGGVPGEEDEGAEAAA